MQYWIAPVRAGCELNQMNEPLARMLKYDKWATETLLTACASLTDAQLAARMPGVSGSVGELLTHLVGSRETFVLRTQGRQHEGELGRHSAWPGFDVLIESAANSSDALLAIAAALDEDSEVDLPYMAKTFRFPKSFFLVHAVEHGVEHRTEVKVALNQMGIATPDLDAWAFAAAAGYGREV
jgi:uncharacterized damage-inducible protein DinB